MQDLVGQLFEEHFVNNDEDDDPNYCKDPLFVVKLNIRRHNLKTCLFLELHKGVKIADLLIYIFVPVRKELLFAL